jgi:hypothetical protein
VLGALSASLVRWPYHKVSGPALSASARWLFLSRVVIWVLSAFGALAHFLPTVSHVPLPPRSLRLLLCLYACSWTAPRSLHLLLYTCSHGPAPPRSLRESLLPSVAHDLPLLAPPRSLRTLSRRRIAYATFSSGSFAFFCGRFFFLPCLRWMFAASRRADNWFLFDLI